MVGAVVTSGQEQSRSKKLGVNFRFLTWLRVTFSMGLVWTEPAKVTAMSYPIGYWIKASKSDCFLVTLALIFKQKINSWLDLVVMSSQVEKITTQNIMEH
jgi:putative solute:sodium symporter small subunit